MTNFTNFHDLRKIEDEALKKALANDLKLYRNHIPVINGYILEIHGGTKESLRLVFLSDEIYNSFTKPEKDYYFRYYGIFSENM